MLTAKSQEMDKISGLMTGADDYIVLAAGAKHVKQLIALVEIDGVKPVGAALSMSTSNLPTPTP